MKQKVHIIRAILEDADYMLLDEPFIGLDRDSVNTLMDQILTAVSSQIIRV